MDSRMSPNNISNKILNLELLYNAVSLFQLRLCVRVSLNNNKGFKYLVDVPWSYIERALVTKKIHVTLTAPAQIC